MTENASPQDPAIADPREQGAKPEYPQRPISAPGSDAELTPLADHGESTYRGLGRLTGRVALITGGDSGIGRAVALAYARAKGPMSHSATCSRKKRMLRRRPVGSNAPIDPRCAARRYPR